MTMTLQKKLDHSIRNKMKIELRIEIQMFWHVLQ